MPTLEQDLRYAEEGLAQMQEPDAGYFEDPEHPTHAEIRKYNRDVSAQTLAIDRLQRKIVERDRKAAITA